MGSYPYGSTYWYKPQGLDFSGQIYNPWDEASFWGKQVVEFCKFARDAMSHSVGVPWSY